MTIVNCMGGGQGETMIQLSAAHRGIAERLICLHDEIKAENSLVALSRIAVALYDPATDILKTFIHSSDGDNPVDGSSALMAGSPSLMQLASTGARRIVNDLGPAARSGREFARKLYDAGYRSSYTVPISNKGTLYGFLFFNSFQDGFFQPPVIQRLRPYAELISLAVMRELDTVRMMQAAVKVIRSVSSARDEETGSHLARMAHYARLIATKMHDRHGLTDEYIEFLFQFCPLHDVGKVAVPDSVLLKPGSLTTDEFEQMKGHVAKGVEIIDLMMRDFGLKTMPYFDVLRNIVAYHHETLDGRGYPYGLSGGQIPVESRIAAVADVFDALTSVRPYKAAWTNEEALNLLRRNAGVKYDPECVEILASSGQEIAHIQARFIETVYD